jgi:hypothetical protein
MGLIDLAEAEKMCAGHRTECGLEGLSNRRTDSVFNTLGHGTLCTVRGKSRQEAGESVSASNPRVCHFCSQIVQQKLAFKPTVVNLFGITTHEANLQRQSPLSTKAAQ